ILERDGKIVKSEIKTFDPTSGNLIRHEITDVSNNKIFQTVRIPNPVDEKSFLETKRNYVFKYHSEYRKDLDKFLWELEIQENTRFIDPLDLESALFFPEKLGFDRADIQKLRKNLEFYKTFQFYENGSGANYVKKLLADILRVKPFEKSIQFVEKLEKGQY
ncbi:uncharacterized protein METZ01_LOCUS446439, partial [marine metagenome]